jgi:hypothetical protein
MTKHVRWTYKAEIEGRLLCETAQIQSGIVKWESLVTKRRQAVPPVPLIVKGKAR